MKRFFVFALIFSCLASFTCFATEISEVVFDEELPTVEFMLLDSGNASDFDDLDPVDNNQWEGEPEFLDSGIVGDQGTVLVLDKLFYKLDVISSQLYVVIGIFLIWILLKMR